VSARDVEAIRERLGSRSLELVPCEDSGFRQAVGWRPARRRLLRWRYALGRLRLDLLCLWRGHDWRVVEYPMRDGPSGTHRLTGFLALECVRGCTTRAGLVRRTDPS
jgi:hypothetical protein